ncbi:hypothetical protein [Halosimplex pelagicum]|uniref:Uncharacterized protein n=1 Tax=Halosimplex pelagicum TaxID=869886 RepID=A0A7D5T8E7_9EURY|nr:hypothetical protein [Halosimplex pelagicum]QLH80890.1 hypothetical protein HZS54_04210 [Halosimplex pelagicum]
MIEFNDNKLVIDDTTVELRSKVGESLEIGNLVVVRLVVLPNETDSTNVLAFDKDGNKVWEIESPPEERDQRSYKSLAAVDGNLRVTNWNGYRYRVDPDSGEVTETGYTR